MKHNRLFLALTLVFTFATLVSAQSQTPAPVMPDFSGWDKVGVDSYPATFDGKNVTLASARYRKTDIENMRRYSVVVVNSESDKPWLAIYMEEIGEKQSSGGVVTKDTSVYLFENINNRWILTKEFLKNSDKVNEDIADFLARRYKLKF